MEAVGKRVRLALYRNKRRTVFRECTVYEYVKSSYDSDGRKYTYWKCWDEDGNEYTFDMNDIFENRIYFINDTRIAT